MTPFGYVTGIHYSNLTDLSWSNDGRLLTVSSIDGFCTFIVFKENELGELYVVENETVIDANVQPLISTQAVSSKIQKPENETKPETNRIKKLFANVASKPAKDAIKENEIVIAEVKTNIESKNTNAAETKPKTITPTTENKNNVKRRIKLVPMST